MDVKSGKTTHYIFIGMALCWGHYIYVLRESKRLMKKFKAIDIIDGNPLLEVQNSQKVSVGSAFETFREMLFPKSRSLEASDEVHADRDTASCGISEVASLSSYTDDSLRQNVRPSICFQGSGCVIVYHIGVARYLQDHFDLSNARFLAASGGSIVAAMLALDLDMDLAFRENCRLAKLSRSWPLGPFGRILDDVAGAFEELLQGHTDHDIAAQLANGRLVLALTHTLTATSRLMVRYHSKEAVINSVWCSMNLPIFLCPWRRVDGEFYCDGGLTNNSPITGGTTVRVSPTDPTAHVVLTDPPGFWEFLIPGDDEYMEKMHFRGWEAARKSHDVFLKNGWRERVDSRERLTNYRSTV